MEIIIAVLRVNESGRYVEALV